MSVPPPPPLILKCNGPLDALCGKHISSMAHIPFTCVTGGLPFTPGLSRSHNWMHTCVIYCFLNFPESGRVHYRPRFCTGHYPIFAFHILSRIAKCYPDFLLNCVEGGGSLSFYLVFPIFQLCAGGGRGHREEIGWDF